MALSKRTKASELRDAGDMTKVKFEKASFFFTDVIRTSCRRGDSVGIEWNIPILLLSYRAYDVREQCVLSRADIGSFSLPVL
jgi:hypothetical protein